METFGISKRFGAQIVCYADDFCILGHAAAEDMKTVAQCLIDKLKLKLNSQKTQCYDALKNRLSSLDTASDGTIDPMDEDTI